MKSTKTKAPVTDDDMFAGYGSDYSTIFNAGTTLTVDVLEQAVQTAMANHGAPQMYIPANLIKIFTGAFGGYDRYPEYEGTPWAKEDRLTKRLHAIAKIHTTLNKLAVLKKFKEDDWKQVRDISVKRLKRAKWARYQQ